MPLFRALAKNMAPMTNADESPTNRLTLFPIYLSLFIVSTLCPDHMLQIICSRSYAPDQLFLSSINTLNIVQNIVQLYSSPPQSSAACGILTTLVPILSCNLLVMA